MNNSYWAEAGFESDGGPWCEAPRGGAGVLILEQANTYSDLAFLVMALAIFFDFVKATRKLRSSSKDQGQPAAGSKTNHNSLYARQPILILINALANLFHWVGTSFNHACRCHAGHVMDVFGMCVFLGFLLVYTSFRWVDVASVSSKHLETPYLVGGFGVAYAVLLASFWPLCQLYYIDRRCEDREALIVTLLVAPLLLCLVGAHWTASRGTASVVSSPWYLLRWALGISTSAVIVHRLDMHGFLCSPESWLQGHAYWHVAMATCVYCIST
jgi:hypothetical protein